MPQDCADRRRAPIEWVLLTCLGLATTAPALGQGPASSAPQPLPQAPQADGGTAGEPIIIPAQYQPEGTEAAKPGESPLNVSTLRGGDSSPAARQAAERALPLQHLTPEGRRTVQTMVRDHSLFRRLPTISFEVRPEVYQFFASRPDVAVSIWRVLQISQFQMWQTGPDTYEVDSGDGSFGVLNVLLRGRDNSIIVCEGQYSTPLLVKPIHASILLHLQTSHGRNAQGKTVVTHSADLFVTFPSQTVETAAKIIAPISNTIADRNFREVSLFVQMMSMLMESQPNWVERVIDRMEGVLKVRKSEMLRLTAQTYMTARQQEMDQAIGEHANSLQQVIQPDPPKSEPSPGNGVRVERLAQAPEETTGRARVVAPMPQSEPPMGR